MKKYLTFIIVLCIFALLFYYTSTKQQKFNSIIPNDYGVLLVYEKGKSNHQVLKAYKSILEEEGVPYYLTDSTSLLAMDAKSLLQSKPAIIFPDAVNQYLDTGIEAWLLNYLTIGGNVLLVGDIGVKTKKGNYRIKGSTLDALLGIQINTYSQKRDKTYFNSHVQFSSLEDIDFFEIPKSKVDTNLTVVGYQYGPLSYPFNNVKILAKKDLNIHAITHNKDMKNIPVIVEKHIAKGSMLYINLLLGYLKGSGDDMLPRSILRTFLFKMAHLPHIVSTPNAKGGLILNYHIDSALELDALPWMLNNGYFLKPLKYSMHIAAGSFCNYPGDKYGFDAAGKGKSLVEKLMPYGVIGSHGGMGHNWFATNVENGTFGKKEIKKYLEKNNRTLETVTHYPIKEYAAPNGIFPQPMSTEILKELGMTSYCYPGDSGSAPNRTFYNGKMVSKDIIAFPVMTFGTLASLAELNRDHHQEEEVFHLLKDMVDFTTKNRVTRLYYTHPYDILGTPYEDPFKKFLYYAIMQQERGLLTVQTMTYFRDFLLKVIQIEKTFMMKNNILTINLHSIKGFKDITIAIPKIHFNKKLLLHKGYLEDDNYYYIPTDTNNSFYHMEFGYE